MSRTTTVETHPSLMRRLEIGNDEAAWQEFAARYAPLIRRYAYSCGLQHNDAEDVCQLTLIKLTRTFESFRYDPARGRFRDYLGRVVRSVIASEIARPIARRGTVFTIDPALEVADPTPSGRISGGSTTSNSRWPTCESRSTRSRSRSSTSFRAAPTPNASRRTSE
jgi:RNA polymerase sigma factor (sigma-70 family)